MEKVGYMPIHQEAKKLGQRNSWGIWTRWLGNDNSFQAVAIDGYTKFSDIMGGDYGKAIDNILPTKKSGEVFDMMSQMNKTDQIRKFVKTEIWELVDGHHPKEEIVKSRICKFRLTFPVGLFFEARGIPGINPLGKKAIPFQEGPRPALY